MGDNRPTNPKINDIWVTDAGALEYYDGRAWVPYVSPEAGPAWQPVAMPEAASSPWPEPDTPGEAPEAP